MLLLRMINCHLLQKAGKGILKVETNQYLVDFYNNYDEDSRLVAKHGTVEFLTTMRYIEKYIKPEDYVLEIGAGTGRYSHALARQGYAVEMQ